MTKPIFKGQPLNSVIVAFIAVAVMLSSIAQSTAACGGYCKARQTLTVCHRAVTTNDLETHKRDAEFEKCKSDPLTYRVSADEAATQLGMD